MEVDGAVVEAAAAAGRDERSLVWMVKNGDLEALKEAVEKHQFDVNTLVVGRYPIHYAADYGHRHLLEYMLGKGAKVNVSCRCLSVCVDNAW